MAYIAAGEMLHCFEKAGWNKEIQTELVRKCIDTWVDRKCKCKLKNSFWRNLEDEPYEYDGYKNYVEFLPGVAISNDMWDSVDPDCLYQLINKAIENWKCDCEY